MRLEMLVEKMRLEMLVESSSRILICVSTSISSLIFSGTGCNTNNNLSMCGLFLLKLPLSPDFRVSLPAPKETYALNLSKVWFEHLIILHPNSDFWYQEWVQSWFTSIPRYRYFFLCITFFPFFSNFRTLVEGYLSHNCNPREN